MGPNIVRDTKSKAAARCPRCVVADRGRTLALMIRHRLSLFVPALTLVAALVAGCVQVSGTAQPTSTPPVEGTSTQNAVLPGSTNAPVAGAVSTPTPAPVASTPADPFAPVVEIGKQAQPSVVTVLTENGLGSGII